LNYTTIAEGFVHAVPVIYTLEKGEDLVEELSEKRRIL
jgi:hypothetical protein